MGKGSNLEDPNPCRNKIHFLLTFNDFGGEFSSLDVLK